MEMHDLNDREFWREYCEKYGMDLGEDFFDDDRPRFSSDDDSPRRSRKRGGFTPFISIGITFGKD